MEHPVVSLGGLRIVIADDHTMVRMGFRLLIESADGCVVAEADSGEAAIEAWDRLRPDLLIMDVSMPGMGGLDALARLLAHHPEARVLMLSAHDDVQTPQRALKAGALGYLSKRAEPQELLSAARTVASGRRYLDREIAPAIALAQMEGPSDPLSALTAREFAVFLKLAEGRSVTEIAAAQGVSASTVGTHLYHIKQKLGAANAADLTLIALRAGLIQA